MEALANPGWRWVNPVNLHHRWWVLGGSALLVSLAAGCHQSGCSALGQEVCVDDHRYAECYAGEWREDLIHDCPADAAICSGSGHCQAFRDPVEPPPVTPNDHCVSEVVRQGPADARSAVTAADVTGDGLDDLLFEDAGTLHLALATGDRRFDAPIVLAANVTLAALGRFDADELLDVVVETPEHTFLVISGRRTGGFPPPVALFNGNGLLWRQNADFDGDGLDDVFLRDADRSVVLRRSGDGYRIGTSLPMLSSRWFAAPDLDGDGRADLLVWPRDAPAEPRSEILLAREPLTWEPAGSLFGWPSAVGDFDRDGKVDLVISHAQGAHVYNGTGDGHFVLGAPLPRAGWWTVADLDGDGDLDLAELVPRQPGSADLRVAVNRRGEFFPLASTRIDWPIGHMFPARIDRSGKTALLAATADDVRVVDPFCE